MIQETVADRPTASPTLDLPGSDQPVEDLLPLLPPRLVASLTAKGFIRVCDLVSPDRQAELQSWLASWQVQQLREALELWPLQYAQDLRDLDPLPEGLDWYQDWDGEDDWDFLAEEDPEDPEFDEVDDEDDEPHLDRVDPAQTRVPAPACRPALAV